MYGQLYLSPEFAPHEKSEKIKEKKKSSVQTDLPRSLTADDFIHVPNGGFHQWGLPITVPRGDCEAPVEYMFSFIRRFAPIHMKAFNEYRHRLEELRRLLAEEYVRCHAETEREHPEWFEGGPSVNPDKISLLPFVFSSFRDSPEDGNEGYGTLDEYMWEIKTKTCIPLSICADLVKKLNIHIPVSGYESEKGVFTLAPGARVKHLPVQDDSGLLRLYRGDVEQMKRLLLITQNNMNLSFPDTLPQPFGALSKIYAREAMFLSGQKNHYAVTPYANSYFFRLYSAEGPEREEEAEELKNVIMKGMSSWEGFVSESVKSLLEQAERNLLLEEQKLTI